jgi:exo-beta-1,3-glucanase (GH17 family)
LKYQTYVIAVILTLLFSARLYAQDQIPLQCVAFSPYVDSLNPDYGDVVNQDVIDNLLDVLTSQTPFRCIMTYGVTQGLEKIFPSAKKRGLRVIAILWIDNDPLVNTASISIGIALARQYPETIIRLSCGSETRTRHHYAFDSETLRCLDALREAKVQQPIGVIDTWWEWCNRERPCHQNLFSQKVDWVGINVFPWWENQYSGFFPCTTAQQAAVFHLARWREVARTHPEKEVILTEFGWPSAPLNNKAHHLKTKECGIASQKNQQQVISETFAEFEQHHITAVAFEAFSEKWKAKEDAVGQFWGICAGTLPYTCSVLLPHYKYN